MPKETQTTKTAAKPKSSSEKSAKSQNTTKQSVNKNKPKKANDSPKSASKSGESKKTQNQKQTTNNKLSIFDYIKTNNLVNKYTKYALTSEYKGILFIRKYLKQANKKVWVKIVSIDAPECYEIGYLQFKTVVCELYDRTIQPEYPHKSQYPTKEDYELACRAIDWETANKDIRAQKRKGIKGRVFKVEGVVYLNKKSRPQYFLDSAPDSIKALANNFENRKNDVWAKAYGYINPEYLDYDEFQYKIKSITQIT